ncbi:MAG: sporulation protein YqfC [Dorea sp.]|jgi:sporulation protein YqfC|nr:sporulation protein YqfC [Dorea sp.]MDE6829764.1 YabP/YqfC family sporulation protein [Lachnospiraceae bacterium]
MNGVSMRGKRQNQRQDEESHSFRNKIAELSELPKDVALGMPVLTVTGQMELCLENYRGIIEYTDTLVRIQTKTGQIRITGQRLQVVYYTNDEMKITGRILSIEYQH